MTEIWKPSATYPTHEASSLGRIRRVPFVGPMPHGGTRTYGGKPTFGSWAEGDNRYVTVIGPAPIKTVRVARIVCDAFHGPPPLGAVCMHLDENSRNNRPENLAWGTQKQNLNAQRFVSETRLRPRILTNEDVRDIRASQDRPVDIAARYGVKPCTISNIKAGRMRANA